MAPRFSADFVHPLSSERLFKFPRHLVSALEINWIIATSDENICSAVFIDTDTLTETDMETDNLTDTPTDREKDTDMDTDMELEYFSFPYGTKIVAIAQYGLPVTHHGASSNSAMNSQRNFPMRTMTCLFKKIHTAIGTSLQTMC